MVKKMNTELLGSIAQIVLMVVLAYPLGKYIAKVYKGEKTCLDFIAPVERRIFKLCGIDPNVEMSWKSFLKALLTINLFWFFWGNVPAVFPAIPAVEPRRQCEPVVAPVV